MYALAWEGGDVVWRDWWYVLVSGISLRIDLYMTWKDQVFIADVMVIDLTWKTVISSVINRPIGAVANLASLLRFASIKGFMKGTILFQWPWMCTTHLSVIWIVSSSVPIFSMINDQEVIYPCLFVINFSNNMWASPLNVL
jgi:hypothetical protein